MKAVMLEVDPSLLEQRRRLGLDRRDEMWEGVLHMVPAPDDEHQRLQDELLVFLKPLLTYTKRGTLRSGINVIDDTSPTESYRIPDLTFVASGREALLTKKGVRGGAPDCVIEIRSPEDETYAKLPFFAKLGVREVIVIERDSKRVEVYALTGSAYLAQSSDTAGGVTSAVLQVRFRTMPGTARLLVNDTADPTVRTEI